MRDATRSISFVRGLVSLSLTILIGTPVDAQSTGTSIQSVTALVSPLAGTSRLEPSGLARAVGSSMQSAAAQPARRRDSVLNGMLIGAGVGALAGLIPDYYDDCEECHDALYASIAVGAGVGLVIDLLRTSRPLSPQSQPRGGLRMGVAASQRAVGVRGVWRWR